MNTDADLPGFIQQFKPAFPVGMTNKETAAGYMQLSMMVRAYVPYLLFIDRSGVIRAQYTGSEPFLADESALDKNFRATIMKLLADNTNSAAKPSKRAGKKKS